MKKAERKKQRRVEAEARKVARKDRTDTERLALIKSRRGNSAKEKSRLLKRLKGD